MERIGREQGTLSSGRVDMPAGMKVVQQILANLPSDFPLSARSISPASTREFVSPAERPLFSALDTGKFLRSFGMEIPAWETCLKLALAEHAAQSPPVGGAPTPGRI
jgi:hypothetical protein